MKWTVQPIADYYLLNSLQDGCAEAKTLSVIATEFLHNWLKKEVAFCVAREMRHFDWEFCTALGAYEKQLDPNLTYDWNKGPTRNKVSWIISTKYRSILMNNAAQIFQHNTSSSIGGLAWVKIVNQYHKMVNATKNQMSFEVDRMIDLSHNTGNVLDKRIDYIDTFLTIKEKCNNPTVLFQFCHPKIRRFARKQLTKQGWNVPKLEARIPTLKTKYGYISKTTISPLRQWNYDSGSINPNALNDYRHKSILLV